MLEIKQGEPTHMQDFHCYQLPHPIDDFSRYLSFEDYCSKLSIKSAYNYFLELMEAVIVLAYKTTILEMPHIVCFMPHCEDYQGDTFENSFQYAYILKQGNNGTTFVVSELPVPSLSAHELVHRALGFNPFTTPAIELETRGW